jgi:multidrug efflux pump subunit AcrB
MSIPRLAIHRPITMFMISAVITLLGLIALWRLVRTGQQPDGIIMRAAP